MTGMCVNTPIAVENLAPESIAPNQDKLFGQVKNLIKPNSNLNPVVYN